LEIWVCDVHPAFLLKLVLAQITVVGFGAHADITYLLFLLTSEVTLSFEELVVLKVDSEEIVCLNSRRLTLIDGLSLGC